MANGRDRRGRWAKGTTGNPNGRPRKVIEEKYLEAFRQAVTIDDLIVILKEGLSKAKKGNLPWAQFICDYLIGKPTQYVTADVATDGQHHLKIEYVNDWRNTVDTTPIPSPGTEDD